MLDVQGYLSTPADLCISGKVLKCDDNYDDVSGRREQKLGKYSPVKTSKGLPISIDTIYLQLE